MRGKKVKALRREVYGEEVSGPKGRDYRMAFGQFTAGAKRADYQRAKKGAPQLYFVAFADASAAKNRRARGVVILENTTISGAVKEAVKVSPSEARSWSKFVYPISKVGPEVKELEPDRYYTETEMRELGYRSHEGTMRRKA